MAVAVKNNVKLDEADRELLNLLQGSFSLEPQPFLSIAKRAGLSESEVLERTQRFKDERVIRELGPIYDTRALGYKSMLVAAKVDHDRRRQCASVVSGHPGVSHNYLRNHEFNLWFTIAVSPNSKLGLDRTLETLKQEAGLERYRQLPTLKLFKIDMNLEMKEGSAALSKRREVKPRDLSAKPLSEDDVLVVRHLQGDMPIVSRPYDEIAGRIGWDTDRLLEHCLGMRERGILRRVAAILYHRRAGYAANGMGVWPVPEERVDELGPVMASFRGITHCYQRPTYPDWPYSIFTMAHGRSREECDRLIHSIATETGIDDYLILYSISEYKKVRLKYFSQEFDEWEALHL